MSDFAKVLVKDPRLLCSDTINYAVLKGGQNMSVNQFNAVSESTSSHVYNIQVPSEQTIVDRRVMWESTVIIKIVVPAANPLPLGQPIIQYGTRDALSPFPLHQATSVMTATINNSSVSINMRDVLPAILRFNDRAELARYNGMTTTAFDTYADYSQAVGAHNNPLGAWTNTDNNNDFSARGSWLLEKVGSTLNMSGDIDNFTIETGDGATAKEAFVQFKVVEPLLLSPFIFAKPMSNSQGFYGIQNMNFTFNIGSGDRVWRSADPNKVVSFVSFKDSRLIFNFLTPHPSDLLPARNVVPYYELPRYLTNSTNNLDSDGTNKTLQTSSLQLNQIPDKLVIFVRKPMSDQKPDDPDAFLSIKKISINFNNQSGILSSASPYDLYRYSVENGSNQSWYEWQGKASGANSVVSGSAVAPIRTSGSLLILEFGKDIQITEDFYAPGSLGNFNLQLQLDVENTLGKTIKPEIVIITMNSGVFVNERGTSAQFTGILDKQGVLDASSQQAYSMNEMKRIVGGSFLDTIKSVASKVLPVVKAGLSAVNDPRAQAASQALGAMGYAKKKDMRL
jgi:hypothetical protein